MTHKHPMLETRFASRAQEKRFYDPATVFNRDESGAKKQMSFEADELAKDIESSKNMADERRRDQLNHSFSAWKDNVSSRKYDYPDSFRNDFAMLYADKFDASDDEDAIDTNKHNWSDDFKDGQKLFDSEKSLYTSDEGMDLVSDNFEQAFADSPQHHDVTSPDTFTDEDKAWDKSGYESAVMFGESIDKLAKVSGQYALCEAVKRIYKICREYESR